jgi:H+-transporting ATPase
LILNITISFYQEYKADKVIKQLKEKLLTRVEVIRDGQITTIDTKLIVPDDIVILQSGDIVPADCIVLEQTNFSIDESSVTGESLPKYKNENDLIYSSTIVKTGTASCRVTSTGNKTYFGKVVKLIEDSKKESLLEKDVISIAKFLMSIAFSILK